MKNSREIKRQKNIEKELRIANATTGHEREVHLKKAEKFKNRYKVI